MVDLSRHLEKAEEAARKKNFPFAIQLYHQILVLKPDYEEARRGLHQALDRYASYRKVQPFLAFLSSLGPRISAFFSRLGKNPAGEARAWDKVLKVDPRNQGALEALGDALERAGFLHSAQVVFEDLAGLRPDDPGPWKRVGLLRHRLGDLDGALEAYEKALEADPRDQEALRARKNLSAQGALERTRFAKASSSRDLIKDKEKARELERGQRVVHTREDLAEDLETLEKKLAQTPEAPALLLRKAEILRKMGRAGEAMDILEGLRSRGEGGLAALRLLGELRIQEKEEALRKARESGAGRENLERAREELEETRLQVARDLVQANPTDLGLKFRLGEALLGRGLLDEAVAEFQQAVKDPRFKTEAQVRLARAFRQKGLVDLALSQYSKALESLGTSGEKTREVLYEMGVLLEEKGDLQGAKEKFARIYEEDITFKDVSERLERLSKA